MSSKIQHGFLVHLKIIYQRDFLACVYDSIFVQLFRKPHITEKKISKERERARASFCAAVR